jgi:hypothetical protein
VLRTSRTTGPLQSGLPEQFGRLVRAGVRYPRRHCTIELESACACRRANTWLSSNKGVGSLQSVSPLHGNVNERRQARRPVSCDVEGSDPARRRIQTDGRHLTLVTRISPFAGRVTEAALRGNTKSSVERVELRPAATRMTCSDVHTSTARRHQGVRETASRGSRCFTIRASERANAHPRLARSRTT